MKFLSRTRRPGWAGNRPAAHRAPFHLVLAATILAVVVTPLAGAGAARGADATTSASASTVTKQLQKQRKQIKRLKRRLAALEVNGTTPSGPAGGDLDGTYPDPQIRAGSVGIAEVDESLHLTCFPTQRYLQGACIDAGLRPAQSWPNARDDCLAVSGRLPTLAELDAFRIRPGVTLADPEWTFEITGSPPPVGQAYLINDAGTITQSNQAGVGVPTRQYRCVTDTRS